MAYVKGTQVGGGSSRTPNSNNSNADSDAAARQRAAREAAEREAEAARQRAIAIANLKEQIESVEAELAELNALKKQYEDLKNGIDNVVSTLSTSSSALENTTGQLKTVYTGFKANALKITVENAKAEISGIVESLNSIKGKANEKINALKVKIETKEKELNTLRSQLACL